MVENYEVCIIMNAFINNIFFSRNYMLANIPKYRENEIKKLYNIIKNTLGPESKMRQRRFESTLKLYYPWENRVTIKYMFNTFIKPLDIEYMIKLRSKNIKREYGTMVRELFGSMDANNDGGIDLDEFKYALRKVENINSVDLFDIADTNDDGILDIEEFYRLVAKTPELRNNFDIIMTSASNENYKRRIEHQARIFKNDVTGRRPSLSDIRTPDNICSIDVPLYGTSFSPTKCTISRRFSY